MPGDGRQPSQGRRAAGRCADRERCFHGGRLEPRPAALRSGRGASRSHRGTVPANLAPMPTADHGQPAADGPGFYPRQPVSVSRCPGRIR
jgi:hypothetical protein